MTKRKILFIVAWYPTKDDGIMGGFFRERALALNCNFEFYVLFVSQFLINPFTFRNVLKILSNNKSKLLIRKGFLVEPPRALYSYCYGINDNKLLSLLPYNIYKRIKFKNHVWLEKAYEKSLNHIIRNGFNPDLIYAASIQSCGAFAYYLGKKYKLPYVLSEHSNFSTNSLNRLNTRESVENANAILSISRNKTWQILFCNLKCDPIYIGSMVDETRFPIKSILKNELKNILIVASYTWRKDYITFFRTINLLKKIVEKKFHVTVIGIGSDKKDNEDFSNNMKYWDIYDIVQVISSVERNDMVKYYHNADLLLLTSIAEGMPNTVLEAMACGLPVFSTRCGGVEDIVDEQCGKIFELKDFRSIAFSLKGYLNNEFIYDSDYIRNKVVSNFGKDAYIKKVSSIFYDCLNK